MMKNDNQCYYLTANGISLEASLMQSDENVGFRSPRGIAVKPLAL